jgi:hypothetical protein
VLKSHGLGSSKFSAHAFNFYPLVSPHRNQIPIGNSPRFFFASSSSKSVRRALGVATCEKAHCAPRAHPPRLFKKRHIMPLPICSGSLASEADAGPGARRLALSVPRARTPCSRPFSEGTFKAGDNGAVYLTVAAGGSYWNRSSGIGIVCKSSGVIGGERRTGGGREYEDSTLGRV